MRERSWRSSTRAGIGSPLILILSAYKATEWELHLNQDVVIQKIILNGANQHTVIGTEDIPIIDYSGPGKYIVEGPYNVFFTPTFYEEGLADDWLYEFEEEIGTRISTFTGCHRASEFTIGQELNFPE